MYSYSFEYLLGMFCVAAIFIEHYQRRHGFAKGIGAFFGIEQHK